MKVIRIIGRNIRDSFKSIFRNFSLSLASISSITITLIVVAMAIMLAFNVTNSADFISKTIEIVVFLDEDIEKADINKVEDEINKTKYVESYVFKSNEEIIAEYRDSSDPYYKAIFAAIKDENNPLKHTFKVKVTDTKEIGSVAAEIEKIDGVFAVSYGKEWVEKLLVIFDVVKRIGTIAVISLVLVTAFLISNTIKITIFSRKREIEIMRLVGASNLNIKIPFILEGLFIGLIGSVIPIIATTYGYVAIYKFDITGFIPLARLVQPTPFIYQVSLVLIAIGGIVGMFGSWAAVRKYLKI